MKGGCHSGCDGDGCSGLLNACPLYETQKADLVRKLKLSSKRAKSSVSALAVWDDAQGRGTQSKVT